MTPEEAAKELEAIPGIYADAINQAEVAALNYIHGRLGVRVFNAGKKADDSQIGQYKRKAYIAYRKAKNRQVAFVDLQLTGDMRRSIRVAKSDDNSNALGFISDAEAAKAAKHDAYYGPIFEANAGEIFDADASYFTVLESKVKNDLESR